MTSVNASSNKKIGLYFGTFNPIHLGHLVIANHMATYTDLDEVWLVVTPLNPQKSPNEMMNQEHRLRMVNLAVSENELLMGCDAEFELPQPNYTAATMRHMRSEHPDMDFSVIIGEDNFERLHTWRDHWELVQMHRILVYPRRSSDQGGACEIARGPSRRSGSERPRTCSMVRCSHDQHLIHLLAQRHHRTKRHSLPSSR